MLETLSIDSGHLSYHLDSLGDLITRTEDGKYKLSSFGLASVKLMSGVEEHRRPATSKSSAKIDTSIKIVATVLVAALLIVSIYSISFTTDRSDPLLTIFPEGFVSASGRPFDYNLTLVYGNAESRISEPNGFLIITHEPSDTVSEWTWYPLMLDLEFNGTLDFFYLRVYGPNNYTASNGPLGTNAGSMGAGLGYMTRPGSYIIEIENTNTDLVSGNFSLQVTKEVFQKPLFYYGLAGIIIAFIGPLIILSSWIWIKRAKLHTARKKGDWKVLCTEKPIICALTFVLILRDSLLV